MISINAAASSAGQRDYEVRIRSGNMFRNAIAI
jgi:hypothetical protein